MGPGVRRGERRAGAFHIRLLNNPLLLRLSRPLLLGKAVDAAAVSVVVWPSGARF